MWIHWPEILDYWSNEIKEELNFWNSIDKALENNVLTQQEAKWLLDSYNEKKYWVISYSKEQLYSLQKALWVSWDNILFKNAELEALRDRAQWDKIVSNFTDIVIEWDNIEDNTITVLEKEKPFEKIQIDWSQMDNPDYENERWKKASLLIGSKMSSLEWKFIAPLSRIFNPEESNNALKELTDNFREHDLNNDWITTTWEIMCSIWLIGEGDIEEYTLLEKGLLDTLSKTEVQEKLQKILRNPDVSITIMSRMQKDIPDIFENFKLMTEFSINAVAKHNKV